MRTYGLESASDDYTFSCRVEYVDTTSMVRADGNDSANERATT
jgi:hypothetical protein